MIGLGFGQWDVGRSLTAAAIARQRQRPSALEVAPETARILAALDRLKAGPTGDEVASRLAEDRRRDVEARNREGAEANRAWAATLRAGGYRDWTGGAR